MWGPFKLNSQFGLGFFSGHKVTCIQVRDPREGQFVIANPCLPSPTVKFYLLLL